MSRAITVKVAVPKVIKALETRLATLEKDYASQEEKEAKYQKSYKAWQKQLADFAVKNFAKAENIRTNYRSWNKTLNVDFDIVGNDFPAEPEKDFEVIHTHTYKEMKEEMANAIRILKMTDEETVNTTTYNAVARYL